ncbi:unnamed protein product, partial [Hapterophycus canaliculatus]
GAPIAPLLVPLRSMVEADPLCLADEAAFLGITALQTHCVDEREALLDVVGHTLSAMPPPHGARDTEPRPPGDAGPRFRAWSLETLVYPSVSMAAAGNPAAARVLPLLEAALGGAQPEATRKGLASTETRYRVGAGAESVRNSSAVALGIRRLSTLEGDQRAMVAACQGLERRAGDLRGAAGGGAGGAEKDAAAVEDLECGLCLLSPLFLRPQQQAHGAACAALVAVVRAAPALGVRLLPFVLYAIRRLGGAATEGSSVACLLHVLPELGAHKLAAKPVAGVIRALAKAPQAAVRGLGLRLAAALVRVNSRTFNMLQSLLAETPADHAPPLSPEPDESRLCRVAGMLEICEIDPELGLECVRPLQAFLGDASGAVTALALKAIAALCRGDCLDFDAALRIVTKRGKVAHTGGRGKGQSFGDPRVMEGMAQLCGAGAEAVAIAAAEAAGEDSDDSGDGSGARWGMGKALDVLLEDGLGLHPDGAVRAAVYAALGEHLPALLQAATGKDAEEDAIAVALRLSDFLGRAISTDESVAARSSLQKAAGTVLTEESVDPSTWVSSKCASGGRDDGKKGSKRSGPSNRLLAELPAPERVLQAFRQDDSSCPGLAGAVLWSYPAPGVEIAAAAHRDTMVRDLGELMAVEGTGGGLALCPWQRAGTPVGIQRYVARLLAACLAAEAAEAASRGQAARGADVTSAAVEACRRAIENLRGVQGGLVAVASASLASCAPASFSHLAVEETGRAVSRLRGLARGAQTLLDGEEIFPLCAAMAARALPETSAEMVETTLGEIERFHGLAGGQKSGGGSASAMGKEWAPNEAQTFWSCVALGVVSEWGLRHPTAPGARNTVLRAVQRLLAGLADTIGSDHLCDLADTWFRANGAGAAHADRAAVWEWESIDIGQASGRGDPETAVPTTARGSRCLGLFLGLSSTLPGLRATGLHLELLQVFNIVRALALKPEVGLCGATLCLAAAASECLPCGLLDAPVILACLRSVSLNLDSPAPRQAAESRKLPAQDTCLGAAGLVAACEGKVVLPAGFVESMCESLRKAAAPRRGSESGVRVASMFALATVLGCPPLVPGELVPRRMRVASAANRRMVETLSYGVLVAMEGTSIRPKNAAARVWGCMAAVGQDERSAGDPRLQEALGWAEGGEELGGGGGGRGGKAGSRAIKPDALCVARDGTLMNVVLTGLQAVAAGMEDGGEASRTTTLFVPERPSLFAASAMACLLVCPILRVPHPQVAVVIEALFLGGHGADVQIKCVSLALKLAGREQAYSTWLYGLFRRPLFVNLPLDVRRHLISVLDQVFVSLPADVGKTLAKELWDTVTSSLFAFWSSALGSGRDCHLDGGRNGIKEATAFLSRMSAIAAAGNDKEVESITFSTFLPSILEAFRGRGDVSCLDANAEEEAPLWDALVGLLSRLPWKHVKEEIASGPEAATSTMTASAELCDRTIRQYLMSRLTLAGETKSTLAAPATSSGQPLPAPSAAAAAAAAAKLLGSVARWATRAETDRGASAVVLPRVAEGLTGIKATAAAGKWLLALLDTAELPESCVVRALTLVGGAVTNWEPSSKGRLVVGGMAGGPLGRGMSVSESGAALLYSMGVAAPRAVLRVDKASPDLSTEVIARLLKLTGVLHGRQRGAMAAADERAVAELVELRHAVQVFIRGLRHAPAVLNGALSRPFASFAESVATFSAEA